tara:strand:- start:11356 stop:11814 length:459 start_codon:yes stop_codon:yes gene_type:complete
MPLYDYKCNSCNKTIEVVVSFADKKQNIKCQCGSIASLQFPVSAIKGFQPFESYYDESLNVDIHGRRHKQQVMKALNVIEAGDKVHGARNYDSSAPENIKPVEKLSGRSIDDYRREEEKREEDKHNFVVSTENKDGQSVEEVKRASDLPNIK